MLRRGVELALRAETRPPESFRVVTVLGGVVVLKVRLPVDLVQPLDRSLEKAGSGGSRANWAFLCYCASANFQVYLKLHGACDV